MGLNRTIQAAERAKITPERTGEWLLTNSERPKSTSRDLKFVRNDPPDDMKTGRH